MIKNMDEIFKKTKNNPRQSKVENGKALAKCENLTQEIITRNFAAAEPEYKWLCKDFNEKNVDISYAKDFYEYVDETKTLSYKFKHVIVVVLRKMHVYDKIKEIIGKP